MLFGTLSVCAQGKFTFSNFRYPTRLGSAEGPLAELNIVGQILAGLQPENLSPLDTKLGPVAHHHGGIVNTGVVIVPNSEPGDLAYMQIRVWDSELWGLSPANIPPDQFGYTDLVSMRLGSEQIGWVVEQPPWTVAAIVPVVPEPPLWALLGLGGAALWGMALKSRIPRARVLIMRDSV